MHLIIGVQEELPDQQTQGSIGKFVKRVASKQYSAPFVTEEWSKIRPREIRFFDFTIPESIEDQVLEDLAPYVGGKLTKLTKVFNIPILKGFIERLGLKQVDMEKYIAKVRAPETRVAKDIPARIVIIGKLEDGYTEDGRELL